MDFIDELLWKVGQSQARALHLRRTWEGAGPTDLVIVEGICASTLRCWFITAAEAMQFMQVLRRGTL